MHLIRQHIFDINCSSANLGKEVSANLSYVLEKEFYPQLGKIFDQYSEKDQIWLIDHLEIEISEISEKNWKEETVKKSLDQIEYFFKLNHHHQNSTAENADEKSEFTKLSLAGFAENLFLQFLKSGRISDNSVFSDVKSIIGQIKISEIFYLKIMESFKDQYNAVLRWIFSVPAIFRYEVYRFSDMNNSFSGAENLVKKHNPEEKKRFSEFLMLMLSNEIRQNQNAFAFTALSAKKYWDVGEEKISEFFDSDKNQKNEKSDLFKNWKNHINSDVKDDFSDETATDIADFIYVENAGLTILHPFFLSLFGQLNLTENNVWKSVADAHRSVLLMHFLVYGNEFFEEHEMTLNKLLCGLPSDEVINVNITLNEDEKEACEDLLKAAIQHWSVMGNSSTDALRETFLQRKGKLEFKERASELYIEEKGFDVLLNKIPWSVTNVKTPWMEQIMFCHWNN
ncbi:hypothetical protein ASG31_03980 [Chryseobacterium sp. Leaf404]|uniref:contractile injection system tape measure protein n=1 Tax=unclassified Chryseobacterium TaxID=2593645 RepID=UPI0006F2DFC0|nr:MULTISPECIES: contractile injection system tape measure protein [unclassified Chryseobacterium]KQT17906.1 hypothetical protein ASG31_03980 [Chryseobacterium sp. Leaf404]